MTREAFDISERFHFPVLVRLVTRLAHSRGIVITKPPRAENPISKPKKSSGWIMMPSNAKIQWRNRLNEFPQVIAYSEKHPANFVNNLDQKIGVITTGVARTYFDEMKAELKDKPSHLHIGVYPFPPEKIRNFSKGLSKLVILEDGYPYLERYIRGVFQAPLEIVGKESGQVPPDGELTADIVRQTFALQLKKGLNSPGPELPIRPPQLCAGCPHIDSYAALKESLSSYGAKIVTSDIGCYTLGAMPEYNAIETCVCMGASIGMAKGASDAGLTPAVAVIGDSTFFHSGITPLLDAISHNTNMTLIILDNETTAMTGGQPTIVTAGKLKKFVLGLGVNPEHVHELVALKKFHAENAQIIKREIEYNGISVIITQRECIETLKRKKTEATK